MLLVMASPFPRRRFAGLPQKEAASDEARSRVVVVTSSAVISEGEPDRANAPALEKMLERGVCELAGKSALLAAWQTFFGPSDAVATCDAGFHLQNVPELTVAILKGLAFAGVQKIKLGSPTPPCTTGFLTAASHGFGRSRRA